MTLKEKQGSMVLINSDINRRKKKSFAVIFIFKQFVKGIGEGCVEHH